MCVWEVVSPSPGSRCTCVRRDLDLVDQSMVFVAMGAPMAPDQFGLEVYIYRPDDTKAPFKHIISNFPASETQR